MPIPMLHMLIVLSRIYIGTQQAIARGWWGLWRRDVRCCARSCLMRALRPATTVRRCAAAVAHGFMPLAHANEGQAPSVATHHSVTHSYRDDLCEEKLDACSFHCCGPFLRRSRRSRAPAAVVGQMTQRFASAAMWRRGRRSAARPRARARRRRR
eukprot:scaffold6016_cov119-Isochrysis_galbana.AAC.8